MRARSIVSTLRFFGHLLRDLAGSFRNRWSRFHRRLAGEELPTVVAVDVFPFTERKTGVGWYEWNLLGALDRVDEPLVFNLYAHTFLAPEDGPAPELPGSTKLRLRAHHLPADLLLPIRPTLAVLRRVVEPLLRTLDNNDVLFAPNFFVPRTQLPYGKSIVATVHDLAFSVMPETVAPETLDEISRNLPTTLYHADRLIVVSDATGRDLVEWLSVNPRRLHTIHEGLDPEFATVAKTSSEGPRLPESFLLFVSTLEPRKNVTGVLRAFRLLVEWGYGGHLVLVGRWGWRTESIRREYESSPVRSSIVHLDYVERRHLPRLYRDADALLFPSWIEGFGLPLLEAMACGTPVVTSGRSAMPEVAGPAAVYVDPSSPHGIASAAASLIEDEAHRDRLVRLGVERAGRFSWLRAAEATAQTLRGAAGGSSDGADEYRV
jgi:glycosyltransferase involved in cell wall biosynthesis